MVIFGLLQGFLGEFNGKEGEYMAFIVISNIQGNAATLHFLISVARRLSFLGFCHALRTLITCATINFSTKQANRISWHRTHRGVEHSLNVYGIVIRPPNHKSSL